MLGAAGSMASSPGTSGGQSYYVPTGLPGADQGWQNINGMLQNYYGGSAPYIAQQAGGTLSNATQGASQYGPAYQNAANAAGQSYGNLAQGANSQAGLDFATQQQLLNAGQNVYQTALDPQNALYNRTAQQLQDQTGATNSMYGLGSSGAGAGVANQALSNFNIDWQNNQLQRQTQGLQAYGQAAGAAGQYGTTGMQNMASIPGYQLAAGQTPYSTNQSIATAPFGLLNQYSGSLSQGVFGPGEGVQNQAIPYMNNGQGAQAVPYQNAYNNSQALGGALGSAAQGIGNSIQNSNAYQNFSNPASGSFSGGNFSNAFSSSPYYSGDGNSYGFTM